MKSSWCDILSQIYQAQRSGRPSSLTLLTPLKKVIIVPLTSKVSPLLAGEFVLADWKAVGLNVTSAAKRGLYTVHQSLVVKSIGRLSASDARSLDDSSRDWLGLR